MRVDELKKSVEKSISDGQQPFFVAATAGTTVLGAIDPLSEIHEIAKQYNMWFHVDVRWL